MFEKPARRAISQAPTTPPAGPLSMVLTGSRAAIRAETAPPLDCIIRSLAFREAARSLRSRTPRYRLITGARYAFTTVVEVRSYSRYSGRMRWLRLIGILRV